VTLSLQNAAQGRQLAIVLEHHSANAIEDEYVASIDRLRERPPVEWMRELIDEGVACNEITSLFWQCLAEAAATATTEVLYPAGPMRTALMRIAGIALAGVHRLDAIERAAAHLRPRFEPGAPAQPEAEDAPEEPAEAADHG
jgi:hypothetical protein